MIKISENQYQVSHEIAEHVAVLLIDENEKKINNFTVGNSATSKFLEI